MSQPPFTPPPVTPSDPPPFRGHAPRSIWPRVFLAALLGLFALAVFAEIASDENSGGSVITVNNSGGDYTIRINDGNDNSVTVEGSGNSVIVQGDNNGVIVTRSDSHAVEEYGADEEAAEAETVATEREAEATLREAEATVREAEATAREAEATARDAGKGPPAVGDALRLANRSGALVRALGRPITTRRSFSNVQIGEEDGQSAGTVRCELVGTNGRSATLEGAFESEKGVIRWTRLRVTFPAGGGAIDLAAR